MAKPRKQVRKNVYDYNELIPMNIDEAPSIDIPGLRTVEVRRPANGGHYITLQVEVTDSFRKQCTCKYCGSSKLRGNGYAPAPRIVHDVPRGNNRVDIIVFPPVFFCNECKQPFTLTKLPGIVEGRQMTERLQEYLRKECFLQPFTHLSDLSGFGETAIADIFDEELEKYEEYRASHPLKAPRVLGIDEKHAEKVARGTLVDVDSGLLLDMVEKNNKEQLTAAIKKLEGWQENIKIITCDMHEPYHVWLSKMLPDALIVIDKYHLISNIQQRVKKSRPFLIAYREKKIKEIEDLEERARQARILSHVKSNRRLFNYSLDSLSRKTAESQREYATVISEFPEFALLHNYYHTVEALYNQLNYDDAVEVWNDWFEILPPGKKEDYEKWCEQKGYPLECFEEFTSMSRKGFQKFKPYILNYFKPAARETNATTEGLNNLIEDVIIRGKGYSFRRLRGKCLYASLIHERVTYNLDSKTIKRYKGSKKQVTAKEEEPKKKYVFTEKVSKLTIPPLSIFKDYEWFLPFLSEAEDSGPLIERQTHRNGEVLAFYADALRHIEG